MNKQYISFKTCVITTTRLTQIPLVLALLFTVDASMARAAKITSPEFVDDSDDLDGMEVDEDDSEILS
jgi:hypothetical protein